MCKQLILFALASSPPLLNDSSLWSFDNNTRDSLSGYDGVGVKSPTYQIPGINGYGAALSLQASMDQYVVVSTYLNLAYTSFTIEMWFYPTALSSSDDCALFSQDGSWTTAHLLLCTVRNNYMFFDFFYDNIIGLTYIQVNTWYHVAFVFDCSALTKTIYLNGILDAFGSSSNYQSVNQVSYIGRVGPSSYGQGRFSG